MRLRDVLFSECVLVVADSGLGYDASRLTLVAMERVGRLDPKGCRKFRRKLVAALQVSPALPAVRAEAVRNVERGCGECRGCKGV